MQHLDMACIVCIPGDFMGGSALAQATHGRVNIELLNEIGVDIVVAGNHEFDYGPVVFKERIDDSNFLWLGANILESSSLEVLPGCIPHHIFSFGELRVGVFGVCTCATPTLSDPGDSISFSCPIQASERAVAELKASGAHIIVGITHVRVAMDHDIASQVPGIDILLGGHDHDPHAIYHTDTLIFKCGQNGYWVGSVDINACLNMRATKYLNWSMHSTHDVLPDTNCATIVRNFKSIANAADETNGISNLDAVVCELRGDVPLDTRTRIVRCEEASSGNLFADALYDYYQQQPQAKPDLALVNGGFIRGDKLYELNIALSRRDILYELPFPKRSALINISGEYLLNAIEQELRHLPDASGSFPHFSANVRVQYDVHRQPLQRIVSMCINEQPIDTARRYSVAATEFIVNGGDGCNAFSYGVAESGVTHLMMSTLIANYCESCHHVYPQVEGRCERIQT